MQKFKTFHFKTSAIGVLAFAVSAVTRAKSKSV